MFDIKIGNVPLSLANVQDQRQLQPREKIFKVWPEPLPDDHLQVFVTSTAGHVLRSMPPPDVKLSDEVIKENINKELDMMRGMIKAFLKNPEPPTWEPPKNIATPSDHKFLSDLRIPCYHNGNPSLLFHDLYRQNDVEIKKIFGHGAHKCVDTNCALNTTSTRTSRFICNTSGSGKTRRMLEGLTKFWGFYFVAAPDANGVGVRDLLVALEELPRYNEWLSDLETVDIRVRPGQHAYNSQIVSRHLVKVLAARIVVFQLFLELAIEVDGELQEKHKHTWLLFQLSDKAVPLSGNRHPFLRIASCLRHARDEALDGLVDRLDRIRREFLSGSHFVVGLDEAQQASRMYPRSFISSTNPQEFRSIIREISAVFTTNLPIKLVLSGTGMSLVEVQNSMTSGVSKPPDVELFHELGMFDKWSEMKEFLEIYIPEFILESYSGVRLQQRMREYLHGR